MQKMIANTCERCHTIFLRRPDVAKEERDLCGGCALRIRRELGADPPARWWVKEMHERIAHKITIERYHESLQGQGN